MDCPRIRPAVGAREDSAVVVQAGELQRHQGRALTPRAFKYFCDLPKAVADAESGVETKPAHKNFQQQKGKESLLGLWAPKKQSFSNS